MVYIGIVRLTDAELFPLVGILEIIAHGGGGGEHDLVLLHTEPYVAAQLRHLRKSRGVDLAQRCPQSEGAVADICQSGRKSDVLHSVHAVKGIGAD